MPSRKTTKSKLPPLDFTEDVKKYEAFEEKKEVSLPTTDFSQAKVVGNQVVLPNGAGYTGPRLAELLEAMAKYGKSARRVL